MMLKQSAVTCLKYAAVQAAYCWVQDNLALQLCFNVFLSMQFVEVNIIYKAVSSPDRTCHSSDTYLSTLAS